MKRAQLSLLGFFLASLIFPPYVWSASVTYPTDSNNSGDPVYVDSTTGKAFCAQVPGGAITTPTGSNVPLDGCASTVLGSGDFCTNPGQPGVACKDSNGTIAQMDLPDPTLSCATPLACVTYNTDTRTVVNTVTVTNTNTNTATNSVTQTLTHYGDVYAAMDGYLQKQPSGTTGFSPIATLSKNWRGISLNSDTGDVFGAAYGDLLYVLTAGSSDLTSINTDVRNWYVVDVDHINGNRYGIEYGGSGQIYEQIGGSGPWSSIDSTSRNYMAIAINQVNHDVFIAGYGGYIWMRAGGVGSISAVTSDSRLWRAVTVDPSTGDRYGGVYGGKLYKQTAGSGTWNAITSDNRNWVAIKFDTSTSKLWAAEYGGQLYSMNSTGTLTAVSTATYNWFGVDIDFGTHTSTTTATTTSTSTSTSTGTATTTGTGTYTTTGMHTSTGMHESENGTITLTSTASGTYAKVSVGYGLVQTGTQTLVAADTPEVVPNAKTLTAQGGGVFVVLTGTGTGTATSTWTETRTSTSSTAGLIVGTSNTNTSTATLTGSGTSGYVTRFTGSQSLGNSTIRDDGSTAAIGMAPVSTAQLSIAGKLTLSQALHIGSSFYMPDRMFEVTGLHFGSVSTMFGLVFNPTFPSTTTNTAYGMYVQPTTAAGFSMSNGYGLYLSDMGSGSGTTITNNWALYIVHGKSYMAGSLHSDSTLEGSNLTAAGHASQDLQGNGVTCAAGSNTFTASNGQITACSTTSPAIYGRLIGVDYTYTTADITSAYGYTWSTVLNITTAHTETATILIDAGAAVSGDGATYCTIQLTVDSTALPPWANTTATSVRTQLALFYAYTVTPGSTHTVYLKIQANEGGRCVVAANTGNLRVQEFN